MLKITRSSDKLVSNKNNSNKSASSKNNNSKPIFKKNNGDNEIEFSDNSIKYAQKSRKLKGEKLVKFQKLFKLKKSKSEKLKKLSKSRNSSNFDIIEAKSSFLILMLSCFELFIASFYQSSNFLTF